LPRLPADLVQELERHQGGAGDGYALCPALPLEQVLPLAERMRQAGYAPASCRPYRDGKVLRAAVAWRHFGGDWHLEVGLTAGDARQKDLEWQQWGFSPQEIVGYRDQGGNDRFILISWNSPSRKTQLRIGDPGGDIFKGRPDPNSVPLRVDRFQGKGGQITSVIWAPGNAGSNWWSWFFPERQFELIPAAGPHFTDFSHVSLGTYSFRQSLENRLAQLQQRLQANPRDAWLNWNRARTLGRLGRVEDEKAALKQWLEQPGTGLAAVAVKALAHARLGEAEAAQKSLIEIPGLLTPPMPKAPLSQSDRLVGYYTEALVGVFLGQEESALRKLEARSAAHLLDGRFFLDAARSYAQAAEWARPTAPDRAERLAARAVDLLKQSFERELARDTLFAEPDFDVLSRHPLWIDQVGRPDRMVRGVWHRQSASLASQVVHGLSPTDHQTHSRQLASWGYLPTVLSAMPRPEGGLVVGSLWERRVEPAASQDRLTAHKLSAVLALLRGGRDDLFRSLLRHEPDPRLRTLLIDRAQTLQRDLAPVLARIEEETDPGALQALILILEGQALDPSGRALLGRLQPWLLQSFREHPDPGVHSALEQLLQQRDQTQEIQRVEQGLTSKGPIGPRRWYSNSQGHTLVVVPAGAELLVCPPDYELSPGERQQWPAQRISRSFALATKEVTRAQLQRFLQANPGAIPPTRRLTGDGADHPAGNLTWFDAARYCRWLSEKEGIPEDQMCYPPIEQIKPGMVLPANYLQRTGYRLPTEAEWEFVCRAGTTTAYHFGLADSLPAHAWFQVNAKNQTWPVAGRLPNPWGMFDMYGNVLEWCQDRYVTPRLHSLPRLIEDNEEKDLVVGSELRSLRGGMYQGSADQLRSSQRFRNPAPLPVISAGFRIARTLRHSSQLSVVSSQRSSELRTDN
jgi:formylglycine-generating enzyme required for sulfatase activity